MLYRFWADSEEPLIPIIRRIRGYTFLLHPKFLTSELDQYEPHVLNWFLRWIKTGDCVVDVGANLGIHSLLMSRICGKQGRVYSFEPSPANLRLLGYHKRKNRAVQISIEPMAVSDRDDDSVSFFLLNEGDHASNSLVFSCDDVPNLAEPLLCMRREIRVPAVTLDHFCAERQIRPSLIKIDVEGAELMVLRGAVRLLSEVRPVVVLAVHPWWLPDGQTTDEIVAVLHSHGYRIQNASGTESDALEYSEYLCTPSGL